MNPFRRFLDIVTNPSNSRTVGVLTLLIIGLAIPLTVNIAQKQQELRQQAGFSGACTIAGTQQQIPCSKTCPNGSTVQGVSVQECQSNLQWYDDGTCYASCSTTTASPPPSTTTSCTPTAATTCDINCELPENCGKTTMCNNNCTPINGSRTPGQCKACPAQIAPSTTSCIGTGITSSVFSDGHEEWGGACANGTDTSRAVAIPGTCSCTVAQCLQYSSGPYCWVNNGQKYDDAKGCAAKGAAMPASCLGVATSCPGSGYPVTQGGSRWGGSCPTEGKKEYASVPGSNFCYYASCERYQSIPTNPLCWFNSGVTAAPSLACPASTEAKISFTIGLDGIGQTGDQKNPNPNPVGAGKGSNPNPKHPTRKFFYQVFESTGTTLEAEGKDSINYDSATGKFKGSIKLNKPLPDGKYLFKVRAEGYLAKIVRDVTITGGAAIVPPTNLVTGNSDEDTKLSILDYNNLLGCFLNNTGAPQPYPLNTICQLMDLDDNGIVDQFDYNLFVREISVIQQGD